MSELDLLKSDYNEDDSPAFASLLNVDHERVNTLILSGGGSGGSLSGPGRLVGSDVTLGRAVPDGSDLFLRLPNAIYMIGGQRVEVEDVSGFVLIPVPPNMATGRTAFLSLSASGDVEVKPTNWRNSPRTDGDAELALLPCLGLFKSDEASVTASVYTDTDEIQSNNLLLIEIRSLQLQIDALANSAGEGESSGIALFASTIAVSPTDSTSTKNYIDGKIAEQAALIAALQLQIGAPGATTLISDLDRYEIRENARQTVQLALLEPLYSLETDNSVFVPGTVGNGELLENGVASRDVHSGNTLLDLVTGEES